MKIVLVRHPETEAPWLPDMGHADPPLTALGQLQAVAIAHEIKETVARGQAIEEVLTSPLKAAAATAWSITQALGLEAAQVDDVLSTITPEVLPEDGGIAALAAIQDRAWSRIEKLRDGEDLSLNFVLVSHELTIRALVCKALSMSLEDVRRFRLDPGSISSIEFRRAVNGDLRMTLASLNETCHLEGISG